MTYRTGGLNQAERLAELRRLRRTREQAEIAVRTELCKAKGIAGMRRPEPELVSTDYAQEERDNLASHQKCEAEEADRFRRGQQAMRDLEIGQEINNAPKGEIIGIIEDGERLHFSGGLGSLEISKGAVVVKWSAISLAQPMPDFDSPGLEVCQVRVQGQYIEGESALGAKGRLIPYIEGSSRRYTWGFEVRAD